MKRRSSPIVARRRGTLIPLLAFALVAICLAAAMVLNRFWVDTAEVELNKAAEASALAAAARLASDDRLREPYDASANIEAARQAADVIARSNTVAGRPVELDLSDAGDVWFGKTVADPQTGTPTFLKTDIDPTSVFVVTQSLNRRDNPLWLFFHGLTGQPTAEAQGYAEATIDNRVIGFRPLPGGAVPCLPLGILAADNTGKQTNTWQEQIDLHNGQDRFGYDEVHQTLIESADGIPEMTLAIDSVDSQNITSNVRLLDLGTGLDTESVRRQIARGIDQNDLQAIGGQLILDGNSLPIDCSATFVNEYLTDLRQQIGKLRICMLYEHDADPVNVDLQTVNATRLIALRILSIEQANDGTRQMIVQPAVIATRTAVLSRENDAARNPYIYKLHRTH